MRLITLCLFMLVTCTTNLLAQGKIEPSNDISKMLCKTWQFDYGEYNGKREEGNEGVIKGMTYTFKPDNTFELKISLKVSQGVAGTWKYDPNKKMIIGTIKHLHSDPTILEIISLSDSEMKSRYSIYEKGVEKIAYIVYKIVE